ncbi:GAF domain-containing sensor histidine kinase [Streptomyces sp. K1PA1]|uniref:GAF domain-containing sensor histidine kinase n=1 Tax=Streptomyces tropicalis TaxID=3034234 RepID=A0ABT6A3X3_9ACTN|nr:GAF domain-containing sensor histidine kinase [Streptomyces tropicalis]MDF3299163.1 GAF domain-containing sensor histidine kinase [Streptomyces tropicalis]
MRLDALLSELQEHVQRVRGSRDRMQTLLDAVMAVGGDLDLADLLQRIVQSAVDLVDAEYGALGVVGEESRITQFVTVGMDGPAIARIGHYPQGRGILGLLIRDPRSLRLDDLGAHPAAVGFPAGHPPMRTFLGAPVRVRDRVFGNLYLTDKRGGQHFDADDESVLRSLAVAAGVAIDHARLYDEGRHRERRLAAGADLTRALLSGEPPTRTLRSLADTVREMTDADLVTLALPVGDGGGLVVEAAAGACADRVRGLALPGTTLAAKVFATGESISSEAISSDPRSSGGSASVVPLGPAFFVPVGGRKRVLGVLQVANAPGGPPFDDAVLEMVRAFSDQAALALEVAEHRRDAEQLALLGDRDRIARDLHDLVIQRLFADGLTLQATLGHVTDRPRVAERVQRVVDDLDDTIKVIRTTIFGLQHPERSGGGVGLRARLVAVTEEAAATLGFTPALRMTGLLDTAVPARYADHLLAVLREALSNAARHAHAGAVEVGAEVADGTLRLTVADDGRGIDLAVPRRSGLANLRSRAEELGGELDVSPQRPSGTLLRWTVPLPAPAADPEDQEDTHDPSGPAGPDGTARS